MKKNILQIQQKKFAMSNQGTTLGLVGLAVPVFDTYHKIKGGCCVTDTATPLQPGIKEKLSNHPS